MPLRAGASLTWQERKHGDFTMTFRIPEEYQRKWKSCEVRTDARRAHRLTLTYIHPHIVLHGLRALVRAGVHARTCA